MDKRIINNNFFIRPSKNTAFKFIAIIATTSIFLSTNYLRNTSVFKASAKHIKVHSALKQLTVKEESHLREIAQYMFLLTAIPYTCFGSKPLSIELIPPVQWHQDAYTIWNRVSTNFTSKKLITRKIRHQDGVDFFLVANLPEIECIYHKYKAYFDEQYLSYSQIEETFLEGGEKLEKLLSNTTNLGVFLGYGLNNATLFTKNQSLPDDQKIKLYPFNTGHPLFYYYFSPILPLYFACDPTTDETQSLRTQYQNDRMIIKKLYKEHDLFELMLLRMID